MGRIINCEGCGCEIIAKNNRKRFCNACLKKRQLEAKQRHIQKYGRKRNNKRYAVDAEGNRIPAAAKYIPKNSIVDVVKLASQAGMTYGEYVSKYEL